MCLQTFHGVEKTPLFYYNNQHQEKRFGGSKKGIRFSKKFFETHRKPHGYWVPAISVTKDKKSPNTICIRTLFYCYVSLTYQTRSQVFAHEKIRHDVTCGIFIIHYFLPPIVLSCFIIKWHEEKMK